MISERLDSALQSALVCLLWTGFQENSDENLDDYDIEEFDPEEVASLRSELESFCDSNAADILAADIEPEQLGHDFILTRNGHGAGFWDRGYVDGIGDRLTANCKPYGTLDASADANGTLYLEG